MAGRKENLKSLFSNTRSRVIIIFTAVLLTLAVIIGYFKLREMSRGPEATASLSHSPGVQSIPGSLNPTAQYAQLQEEQNVNQAQKAEQAGGSAIPTIIRTQALGTGVGVVGSQRGETGVGFTTLVHMNEGGDQKNIWFQALQNAGCSKAVVTQVVGEGAQLINLKTACSCAQLKDNGYTLKDLNKVCPCKELKAAGYNATQLKEAGYDAASLRDCGFNACELRSAGFTAQQLKNAGFSDDELKGAGYSPEEIVKARGLPLGLTTTDVQKAGCSVEEIIKLRKAGVSASAIRRLNGCSAEQLKAAGFTPKDLEDAGFSSADCSVDSLKKARASGISAATLKQTRGCSVKALKDAGFSAKDLKDAGFSAKDLKDAGFSAKDLKDAGFSAKDLKDAGFSAKDLKDAGFSAKDLKDAGFSVPELLKAGFSPEELRNAGVPEAQVAGLGNPNLQSGAFNLYRAPDLNATATNQQLQAIMDKQNQQIAEQKHQQKIQQTSSNMLSVANQLIAEWKSVSTQVYIGGNKEEIKRVEEGKEGLERGIMMNQTTETTLNAQNSMIKTGDVLFAVIDTSVNSDEPGPILATIVSGKLKGTKLIGSFNLPTNGNKMVITFNTMSIPGAPRTVSVNAYAIDPNTARTALSSRTNHHYLMRYGSVFASSFLEGFGNAFQSANTTVTIGGTGGGNNVTIANGVGRSTLSNAVIGLATVGKNWGQQAQLLFNRPTTVEVYSGTPVGILFTQDVRTI